MVKRNDIKLQVLILMVLAGAISGCAVSGKSASSDYGAEGSANRRDVPAGGENATAASEDWAEFGVDEDFDLLEEEVGKQEVTVADPLEGVNRIMFSVNDTLYFWVVKPVTQLYTDITPKGARIGIRNFFHNLTTPVRLVNCLLQGKGDAAGTEFNRFVVNTTVGVLGFGDPALDQYGLEPVWEDLGQTQGGYGVGNGLYIVWPLLGPSTARDSVGRVGDLFLNPVFYVRPTEARIAIASVNGVNRGTFHIGEYEKFKAEAVEPYVAMREAYIQYRNKQIQE
ncbi:MAG: MlaA family lipoprotein [Planctomycetota bacterium]